MGVENKSETERIWSVWNPENTKVCKMKAQIIHHGHKNGHHRNAPDTAAGTLNGNFGVSVNHKG